MSECLVPDWQKERGISKGRHRYDFICFELGHYTVERNEILQLSDVWPGYNNIAQETNAQIPQSFINSKASWEKLETCSNSPALIRQISQRQQRFASCNYCYEIISGSFYQSNDTDNDDEMFTMPHCDSDGNDQSHHTTVLSIIHGTMYAPSDGVKWMPKHVALGSILHQATRSTLLVDLLHKAGHIRQTNP